MKSRRILILLLSALLVVSVFAACDQGPATNTKVDRKTLHVGTPAMGGDFIPGFGNISYDLYIKTLVGGYADTYYQTAEGQLKRNDTIVKEEAISYDEAGNKIYTFTLQNNLKWNNGESITAKDYIAGILLYASPKWAAVGASSSAGEGLIGYKAYYEGETETFAGIQILGDYQFSLTIDAAELPYFWETSFVMATPVYTAGYFPGIDVVSGAEGSSFSGDITADCERLAATERFAPTVTCGPYIFESFDGTNVNLKKNPNFHGDWNGKKPTFDFIVQTHVPDETDVDMVLNGDIDLVTGVVEGGKIEKAKSDPNGVTHSYLRAGYGYIGFHCDWGVTADPNVRWAIAYMIDRNTIIDNVLSGYGGTVDAAYGMAQWTYQSKKAEVEAALTPIAFNLEKANDHLDQTEWKFEADGTTPFDRAKANAEGTYMRHNSAGEMLTVRHLSASASVGGAIEMETVKNSPLIGMKYEVTHGDFNALMDNYYYGYDLGADRYYNSFNLASNFTAVDDKYMSYHSDWLGTWYNANQFSDPEIDRITVEMRSLDPSQTEEHAALWVEFQTRWQQFLPDFPLYSNEYYDIYNSVVKGVPTSPYANYCDVICEIEKY